MIELAYAQGKIYGTGNVQLSAHTHRSIQPLAPTIVLEYIPRTTLSEHWHASVPHPSTEGEFYHDEGILRLALQANGVPWP